MRGRMRRFARPAAAFALVVVLGVVAASWGSIARADEPTEGGAGPTPATDGTPAEPAPPATEPAPVTSESAPTTSEPTPATEPPSAVVPPGNSVPAPRVDSPAEPGRPSAVETPAAPPPLLPIAPIVPAPVIAGTVAPPAEPPAPTTPSDGGAASARAAEPAAPRAETAPRSLPVSLVVSALAGWLVSALLATLMLYLVGRWRTAFQTKEWLLLPSDHATRLGSGLEALCDQTVRSLESVVNACNANTRQAAAAASATAETRGEFSILRDELDRKTREIADLKMGHEFHHRRPVLRRLIHALQIIEEDTAASRDVAETLQGVLVELRECLEENSIVTLENPPGTRLAEAKALDVAGSVKEPAPEESARGTVVETTRPAYVARGPNGAEVVLVQSRARIYV